MNPPDAAAPVQTGGQELAEVIGIRMCAALHPWESRRVCASCAVTAEHVAEGVEGWIAGRLGEVWDEAAQALAWCIDNGPAESAAAYVAEHNPYRAALGTAR